MPATARHRRAAPLLEEEVFVGLQRTADWLRQGAELLLKEHGLSGAQYNVLRILRGAGGEGLCCREIAERMITRDPDMTRLLDRMEKHGMVARERQKADRRMVTTRVTRAGLKLLKRLDHPVREYHRRRLRHVPAGRLRTLARFLEEARRAAPGRVPET